MPIRLSALIKLSFVSSRDSKNLERARSHSSSATETRLWEWLGLVGVKETICGWKQARNEARSE